MKPFVPLSYRRALPRRARWRLAWLLLFVPLLAIAASAAEEAGERTIGPTTLAVIVNDADPVSQRIADYYKQRRGIPAENLIHVSFTPGEPVMTRAEFERVRASVTARVSSAAQAYALAWTLPYRVDCLSITTAFAAGYDEAFCAKGCKPTRASPYYDSDSRHPQDDYGWRPAMLLAGDSFDEVKALVDRGVAADGTHPRGAGYLVSTTDSARNVRSRFYPGIFLMQSDRFAFELVNADALRHRLDVMFYFTGLPEVSGIDTNRYLPGAIADHLTSAGGMLNGSGQMSSLRWLRAGATGSYGTVVEPCSFPQKFPRPDIVINRYLNGETLLEAYWKSVAWPGQGVFIGEPLAAPFREVQARETDPGQSLPAAGAEN